MAPERIMVDASSKGNISDRTCDFKLLNLNIRSERHKLDVIQEILATKSPDAAIITETRNPEPVSRHFPGYSLFQTSPSNTGGVRILCKEQWRSRIVSQYK